MTSIITDNELRKALRQEAELMHADTARYLVDAYYQMQTMRIMMEGRERAQEQGVDRNPGRFISITADFFMSAEKEIQAWLDRFSGNNELGQWAREQKGIGPVLAAGLLAHIDFDRTTCVSSVWSFAGLNPAAVWEKKTKRPHNAALKVLCWKIGESFVKTKSRDGAFYGQLYTQRSQHEWAKNLKGEYAHLRGGRRYTYKPSTASYKWMQAYYKGVELDGTTREPILVGKTVKTTAKMSEEERIAAGGIIMIPPQAIHGRSRRYAVKMFLSHFWQVGYEIKYGKPAPNAYVLEHGGHVHKIDPPGWKPLQNAA